MIPLGILGQIYAVCAGIGTIFVIGSFALGHIGEDGGDSVGGDDGGDFGADDGGGGTDFNAGDDGGGTDFNAGDSNNSTRLVTMSTSRMAAGSRMASTNTSGMLGTILGLLSPMTISVYLAFFGLTGLVCASNWPQLGIFTLIPSIIVSMGVSAMFKSMTRWMMKNLQTSTHQKESDLLGQMAEVNVPIHDGRTGEVTYVLNAKRMTASAKPAKPGLDFQKGAKVLIVGSKEHVVLIEPYDPDRELEDRFISQER